ncbi:response regulator [Mangrovibrevibacter kandeliae]|uniref:response regulator n=1 Tax=Mangrovibrevibacter kandeliae TaxID=2968473 RepID=UPI00211762CC|nr:MULTISPECIES: response regulator [unclassified Aurantimonas]MCQ8782962.1 response regulator [Aurantimonas sp. CSK15Z-1]MCW4115844.1 response regulator [Aurantimonas sp. MSK8Z-1]
MSDTAAIHDLQTRVLLLVEDNPADSDIVREMLESVDQDVRYEFHHVVRIEEAKALLEERRVDVVLLDLRLPDASGTEGVKAILEVSQDIPIVVLTGLDDERAGIRCIDAGAQDFLAKDELRPALLRRTIGYAIARLRETQLRETQALLEEYRSLSSAGTRTGITASLAGVGSLRDRDPTSYQELHRHYFDLLRRYVDQLSYKKEKPKDLMDFIATRIGDVGGGARDLLDIHVSSLEEAVQGAPLEHGRALVIEGRLLAVEMMGLLVEYYRIGVRRRFMPGDAR